MPDRSTKISELRWPVIIATREQTPSGTSTLTETLVGIQTVHAKIVKLKDSTYVQGQATDRPVSHRIIIRWLDWLDLTNVIVRNTYRLDRSIRQEIFRVRSVGEEDGRKRFLEILAELETRT